MIREAHRKVLALSVAAGIILGVCAIVTIKDDSELFNFSRNFKFSSSGCSAGSIPNGNFVQIPTENQSHTFNKNALLEVNTKGRHPIFDLIGEAKHTWREKKE